MSTVAIDLFIQDFVLSNRILNQHLDWPTLVSRRFQESGPAIKVFSFKSGGDQEHLAIAQILACADGEYLRIELTRPTVSFGTNEHRMDCLRMMHQSTHASLSVEPAGEKIIVRLNTRHRGLLNIAFVLHESPLVTNPLLAASITVNRGPVLAAEPPMSVVEELP
jgi:hypothetical protein